MVRSGLTFSRMPMSPNWREQSTSATRQERASDTARLAAIADFPAPPLAPTTVRSLPEGGGRRPGDGRGRGARLPNPVGVDPADGGHQLVAAERLLQELAGTGQHGAPEGFVLRLHGEQG